MKKVYVKNDKAVSPIIATILLVAITVVLAATLYTILGGYTTFLGASTPQASITVTNATSAHSSSPSKPIYFVYINQFGGNISLNEVQMIIITSGNNVSYATLSSYHNKTSPLNVSSGVGWNVSVKVPDYLSGSTVITLQGINKNYTSEYIVHVRLVDMVTNGEIGSYTL